MTPRPAVFQLELLEDLLRVPVTRLGGPLRLQPRVELIEAIVGIEDAADHELRRDRSVPVVLLQAEGDVVPSFTPVAVELRPLAEGNRTPRVASVPLHPEAQVLAVADRRQLTELTARCQQRDVGICKAERRQRAQLLAELERELRAARKDGVDDRRRDKILRAEQAFRLGRERVGERFDAVRLDRQARRRAMAAEPLEERRASAEGAVEVERRDRAPGAFPEAVLPGDEDDRAVIALHKT